MICKPRRGEISKLDTTGQPCIFAWLACSCGFDGASQHTVQAAKQTLLLRRGYALNSKTLYEMSQVEIDKVAVGALVDIGTVAVNHTLTHEEKILSHIQQMKNPYCFTSGGVPVRVRFVGKGKPLSQSLVNHFSQLGQR
jgi:hypothetical protein